MKAETHYIGASKVAKMLGRSSSWFYANLDVLLTEDFPEKDPTMKKWFIPAIEDWGMRRYGLDAPNGNEVSADDDPFLKAAETIHG